jgi:hypothetical protein
MSAEVLPGREVVLRHDTDQSQSSAEVKNK